MSNKIEFLSSRSEILHDCKYLYLNENPNLEKLGEIKDRLNSLFKYINRYLNPFFLNSNEDSKKIEDLINKIDVLINKIEDLIKHLKKKIKRNENNGDTVNEEKILFDKHKKILKDVNSFQKEIVETLLSLEPKSSNKKDSERIVLIIDDEFYSSEERANFCKKFALYDATIEILSELYLTPNNDFIKFLLPFDNLTKTTNKNNLEQLPQAIILSGQKLDKNKINYNNDDFIKFENFIKTLYEKKEIDLVLIDLYFKDNSQRGSEMFFWGKKFYSIFIEYNYDLISTVKIFSYGPTGSDNINKHHFEKKELYSLLNISDGFKYKSYSEEMEKLYNDFESFMNNNKDLYRLPLLLQGETGVGKSSLIRRYCKEKKLQFIHVNIAALTESIIESELFGYVKGAFTSSANEDKTGFFEEANNKKAILFLDEIGEISLTTQKKLLTAIRERIIYKLGSTKEIKIPNVQFVFATNNNLELEVQEGRFRKDLYSRISMPTFTLLTLHDVLTTKEAVKNYFEQNTQNDDEFKDSIHNSLSNLTDETIELIINKQFKGNFAQLNDLVRLSQTLNKNNFEFELNKQLEKLKDRDIKKKISTKKTEENNNSVKKYRENRDLKNNIINQLKQEPSEELKKLIDELKQDFKGILEINFYTLGAQKRVEEINKLENFEFKITTAQLADATLKNIANILYLLFPEKEKALKNILSYKTDPKSIDEIFNDFKK